MNRIACSPLTGRIFSGRLNRAGNAFLDGKVDATSDVLRAVVEKADYHGGTFEIEGGGKKWTVRVESMPAARAAEPDAKQRGLQLLASA